MSPILLGIDIHKKEICSNGTSEQMYMGKDYLVTIAPSGNRACVENVEVTPTVQHNVSTDDKSGTTVKVFFHDVTGIKPCPDFSPNQMASRITRGTETTLICKEDTTSLMQCPVFVLFTPL